MQIKKVKKMIYIIGLLCFVTATPQITFDLLKEKPVSKELFIEDTKIIKDTEYHTSDLVVKTYYTGDAQLNYLYSFDNEYYSYGNIVSKEKIDFYDCDVVEITEKRVSIVYPEYIKRSFLDVSYLQNINLTDYLVNDMPTDKSDMIDEIKIKEIIEKDYINYQQMVKNISSQPFAFAMAVASFFVALLVATLIRE